MLNVVPHIDRTLEKERCTYAESTRFDSVAIPFLPIRFLYLYIYSVIVYYVPRRTMSVIARRATMLAGDRIGYRRMRSSIFALYSSVAEYTTLCYSQL